MFLRTVITSCCLVFLGVFQASASERVSFKSSDVFFTGTQNRANNNTPAIKNRLQRYLEARGLPKSHRNLVSQIMTQSGTVVAQSADAAKKAAGDGDALLLEAKDDAEKKSEGSDDLLLEADDKKSEGADDLLLDADDKKDSDGDDLLLDADDKKDGDDDELLLDESEGETKKAAAEPTPKVKKSKKKKSAATSTEDHLKLYTENRYPSANSCASCHPKHYKEWSVSQHAYAQLSPAYLTLNNKINELANGSNGDFCFRCHSPVGANLNETPSESNLDRNPTSREGITCVVCHRINKNYNKASGRIALIEGPLTSAVFGPKGQRELNRVLSKPEEYRVVTDPKEKGRQIHAKAKLFTTISDPIFCGTCHDVTLFNGFRLEEAFSEYRTSPAAAKGITCQDCHMGKIQGKVSGYAWGPAAIVGDVPTKKRKITNHFFAGPDYSLIHPGIFPHNVEAAEFKTLREWLKFNVAAGWGTDKFEDNIRDGYKFPKTWESIDDRYDAREILNTQFENLEWARKKRLEVLRNGYILGKTITDKADGSGIVFRVQLRSGTDGHNVPTGFTGERLVWVDVTVRDRNKKVIFRSGDRDPNGDLRDGHSSYVHAGKIPLDPFLFSLQSIFVTQNGRGGETEHVIPIPYPVTSLPRVLPSTRSLIFTGEPTTERNHKKGIEPLGQRWQTYVIRADQLTGNGPYRATIKLLSQPAPVNLIVAMQDAGFDYGLTPRQAGDAMVAGTQELWRRNLSFDIRVTPAGLPSTPGSAPSGTAKSVFSEAFGEN